LHYRGHFPAALTFALLKFLRSSNCNGWKPLEVDPDDGAEQVDDDEDSDEDDDQMTRVGDDSSCCVHVRHNGPTQLITVKTELFPVSSRIRAASFVNTTVPSTRSRSMPIAIYPTPKLANHELGCR